MNNTLLTALVVLGVGGSMLLAGSVADASRPTTKKNSIESYLNALKRWSQETDTEGDITLGESSPGMQASGRDEGDLVIDVTSNQIQFLRVNQGLLVSDPYMAKDFKDWLAKEHPELMS